MVDRGRILGNLGRGGEVTITECARWLDRQSYMNKNRQWVALALKLERERFGTRKQEVTRGAEARVSWIQ